MCLTTPPRMIFVSVCALVDPLVELIGEHFRGGPPPPCNRDRHSFSFPVLHAVPPFARGHALLPG